MLFVKEYLNELAEVNPINDTMFLVKGFKKSDRIFIKTLIGEGITVVGDEEYALIGVAYPDPEEEEITIGLIEAFLKSLASTKYKKFKDFKELCQYCISLG